MKASTHVFWFETLKAPTPFVATAIARPWTVTVADALTDAVPGELELTMIVHWPCAFVGPVVHVPPMIVPKLVARATVTPAAATQPEPLFDSTVTVNVCGEPTWFVPVVPIEIRASTQR